MRGIGAKRQRMTDSPEAFAICQSPRGTVITVPYTAVAG